MDPNVGRIPTEPSAPPRPPRPVRRRRGDGKSPFDEELAEKRDETTEPPAAEGESTDTADRPVAPPPPGEVGGQIDLTA